MAEEKEKINNVCFCICHEQGRPGCRKCVAFHKGKERAATHKNDKVNPDIK